MIAKLVKSTWRVLEFMVLSAISVTVDTTGLHQLVVVIEASLSLPEVVPMFHRNMMVDGFSKPSKP